MNNFRWDVLGAEAKRNFLGRAIEAVDFMRRSPPVFGEVSRHKEWEHFVILTPELDLLVNFSCCDIVCAKGYDNEEFPRVIVLARSDTWDGDVETFAREDVNVRGGLIDMTMGPNRLVFKDDCYFITVRLENRPIRMDLRLEPRAMPVFVPRIPMIEGPLLNWTVVPRLDVFGTVTIGHRTFTFDGVPAYHDHNWGPFYWGHDCSWDWGFVLPDDRSNPWSLTFVRLSDRARTRAVAQSFLLWRDESLERIFFERQIEMLIPLDYLRPKKIFKVPRPMALVAPEVVGDVPRWVDITARGDGDWVECHSEAYDLAQVLIPSEVDFGVTIFNETVARTRVRGRVRGEDIDYTGKSVLEFIRVC